MSNDCETFEVELGMRQHGALEPERVAALEAHLAGCASCRAFAAATGRQATFLRAAAADDAGNVDWDKMQRGVEALRRAYRRKLWLAPLFLLSLPLALLVGGGHLPAKLFVLAPVSNLLVFLAYLWLIGRPFREVVAVAKSGEPLLAGYVRELRRQRVRTWLFVAWNGSAALVMLAAALFETGARLRLFGALGALGFGAWTAYDLVSRLPRLRRALAEVA
jgi:hypothetical protein